MYQQNVTFLVYISTVKPIRQPNSRSKARLSTRNLNSKRRYSDVAFRIHKKKRGIGVHFIYTGRVFTIS